MSDERHAGARGQTTGLMAWRSRAKRLRNGDGLPDDGNVIGRRS